MGLIHNRNNNAGHVVIKTVDTPSFKAIQRVLNARTLKTTG